MERTQVERKNAWRLVLEGTLFWAGLAFLQGDTVISKFMNDTTGSVALVGLAATLRTVMPMVGQLIMGMFIHRVKRQSHFMAVAGFFNRPLFLLLVPLLMMGMSGMGAAVTFLIIYSLFFLMDGAVGLLWTEICTRTMPIRRRGEVIALQQTFGGLVGFVAGLVVSRILGGSLSFEHKYAVVFAIAGAIMLADAVVLAAIKDVPHGSEPERPVPRLRSYIGQLVPLLIGDKPVRMVLITRALYLLTLISAPLNFVFGQSQGHLTEGQLAMLIFMPVIGQTSAGLLWSQVSKRLDYRVMMLMAEALGVLCAAMNLICFFLARSGVNVMAPLSATMVLIALNIPAYTGFSQQMIAMVDENKRSNYIVMSSLVLCPMAFGTYFSGIVAERFGYLPVYVAMLLGGLAGLFLVWRNFTAKNAPYAEK